MPSPVGDVGNKDVDGLAEGSGEVADGGIDSEDGVELVDVVGGRDKIGQVVPEIDDVPVLELKLFVR